MNLLADATSPDQTPGFTLLALAIGLLLLVAAIRALFGKRKR